MREVRHGAGAVDDVQRHLAGEPQIDRDNLTARAEAGLPIEEFRKRLRAGQRRAKLLQFIACHSSTAMNCCVLWSKA